MNAPGGATKRDTSIQLSTKEDDSSSQTSTRNDTTPPSADLLLHSCRLLTSMMSGASLTVGLEVSTSPIANQMELLISGISMGGAALLTGSILIGDAVNSYYWRSDSEVHPFYHAIRIILAALLGSAIGHLALSGTSLATGGSELLALAITVGIATGLFLATDIKTAYYPDTTIGCCKRTEIIKVDRDLTIAESVSTEDPWHNSTSDDPIR